MAHGGEASIATSGFWAALNIATTQRLPVLFYIEDNGYGISVRSDLQTPGANIAANLASFGNLRVLDGDGSDPATAPRLIEQAVAHVRGGAGPALLRLTVPRLSGHSGQDTQTYKTAPELAAEVARDPLARLSDYLVPPALPSRDWQRSSRAREAVVESPAPRRCPPVHGPAPGEAVRVQRAADDGSIEVQLQGGLLPHGIACPPGSAEPRPTARASTC